jgi:hypothetical protein
MSEANLFIEEESKQKIYNAREVIAKLERKYAPPSWGFFTEVKSSVGFGERRADGIAVAMWRSLGLEIHGFEVKCSRSDWLAELKDAGKSDEIFKYCNRWWIVLGDASIVRDGELPPTWGLQVPDGRGLKIRVKAPKLAPVPLTVHFIAEILRRHFDSMKRPEQLQQEYQRGLEAGKAQATPYDLKYEAEQAKKLKKRLEDFEKASGVKVDHWKDAGEIGQAVKLVMDCGPEQIKERFSYSLEELKRLVQDLEKGIAKL